MLTEPVIAINHNAGSSLSFQQGVKMNNKLGITVLAKALLLCAAICTQADATEQHDSSESTLDNTVSSPFPGFRCSAELETLIYGDKNGLLWEILNHTPAWGSATLELGEPFGNMISPNHGAYFYIPAAHTITVTNIGPRATTTCVANIKRAGVTQLSHLNDNPDGPDATKASHISHHKPYVSKDGFICSQNKYMEFVGNSNSRHWQIYNKPVFKRSTLYIGYPNRHHVANGQTMDISVTPGEKVRIFNLGPKISDICYKQLPALTD